MPILILSLRGTKWRGNLFHLICYSEESGVCCRTTGESHPFQYYNSTHNKRWIMRLPRPQKTGLAMTTQSSFSLDGRRPGWRWKCLSKSFIARNGGTWQSLPPSLSFWGVRWLWPDDVRISSFQYYNSTHNKRWIMRLPRPQKTRSRNDD